MTSPQNGPIFSAIVPAPFGFIGIRSDDQYVHELVYLPSSFARDEQAPSNRPAELAARQVERYFKQADFRFDLPLAKVGTAFQQRVWQAISSIPRGEVLTYGAVAKAVGCGSPRAVGQACGANWFPLVIPCHRVTASGGLGGFSNHDDVTGFHVGVKRWLLAHEGVAGYQ
ncbi:methylated-DNA-[protein]-cysteine S-methyltransferase [Paucimonas lemoignei]|uniref:Methylated-DNA-[protein]-cysteine S-methyltransferase n=1 Tax=Paucimonas lemoignei TaxID=29443 RepID=A0A4R3I0Y5_PAULE|nr:methylated-DNA--[protein]-cysteine S-methyltransferase [Paucimonas lemoignei]TCS38351.1 methylated-DNA-[protein]-cysteine S-methyltransferase [Paucimonas lemoignei]